MDNKITKKRLGAFLSYEWVVTTVFCALLIVLWAFLFSAFSLRFTTGQSFKYYYDGNLLSQNDDAFLSILNKDVFSYDIRNVESESVGQNKDLLSARLGNYEGDAIITDVNGEAKEGYVSCRANEIADSFTVYPLANEEDGILADAVKYLSGFLKDGATDPLNYENLDESKIRSNFDERVSAERIYRNYKNAGEIFVEQEYERIKSLCEEVSFYKKVVEYDATLSPENSIFYRYTLYTQAYSEGPDQDKDFYKGLLDKETPKAYALRVDALNGVDVKKSASDYFRFSDPEVKTGAVIEIFNFSEKQKDLQFESIAFLNALIRNFSDIETRLAV